MTERQRRLALLDELLARRSVEALDRDEETLLARLLGEFRDVDAGAYERTAARIWLAAVAPVGPMPAALRDRILGDAAERD